MAGLRCAGVHYGCSADVAHMGANGSFDLMLARVQTRSAKNFCRAYWQACFAYGCWARQLPHDIATYLSIYGALGSAGV
ncbi:hypothetical protein EJG51_014165 [Undibacterium piscinae]|uniref:Uncharacterized protein n=1 Tax=Undibacterium piscinae TaxID=2495591 RepID=A0A6M4A0Y2_9BURK|nr:hypothetical protein EJG51_014165 [Undibacterium piscinae]